MSSDFQELPSVRSPSHGEMTDVEEKPPKPVLHWKQWTTSSLLFFVTFLCTSFAGLFYLVGELGFLGAVRLSFSKPDLILRGFPFSVPFMAILLAHELGHFFACRYYRIHCTPPYFIPAPISFSGTLGAFIKIKAPFVNRRALFDVGIAGPLAGFLVTIPVLWIGISLSRLIPKGLYGTGVILFGEPPIFRLIGAMALGYSPARHDMLAHPTAMAGWFGLLVTCLNLFPIWQLDGGHIAYAVTGQNLQKKLSFGVLAALILTGLYGWPVPSYLFFGILVFLLGYRQKFYHPATLRDWEPLGIERKALAVLALVILILCFTPVPILLS